MTSRFSSAVIRTIPYRQESHVGFWLQAGATMAMKPIHRVLNISFSFLMGDGGSRHNGRKG
jgi:hypothetical protein